VPDKRGILFTAFEPSGDEHAAAVIAQIKKLRPDIPIWGTGGDCMKDAGAEIIEETTSRAAAMGWGAFFHVFHHLQRLRRLRRWLSEHPLVALVPVDSPAANWSICRTVRRQQPEARIVHMVCPQIWAWASWRIRRLRRLTDHVLCLLPFEPSWLANRGVAASFVGHPVFDAHHQKNSSSDSNQDVELNPMPDAPLKLGLLPGSRLSEIDANWPTMLDAYAGLKKEHPQLVGAVAAINQNVAECTRHHIRVRQSKFGDVKSLYIRESQVETVMDWADIILVASGTATLHVAARRKPMVVLYNINWLGWNILGRHLVKTETFSLPNLISEWQGQGRAVTEFCPHFGSVEPVTQALNELIKDSDKRQKQIAALDRVAEPFRGHDWGTDAARQLLDVVDSPNQPAGAPALSG